MEEAKKQDEQLVGQLQGSEADRKAALKVLYLDTKLKSYILGFVQRNGGNAQDGEDIFQDAIILLDRRVRQGGYKGDGALSGYLQGIARRLWLRKRQQWNERTTEFKPEEQEQPAESYDLELMAEERKRTIRTILEHIGDRCKKILTMYKLKHSMEEIAEVMELATAAVAKNEAYRCRKKFRAVVANNEQFAEILGVAIKKK
jgi:RNA polymerase sigma factor (sigma-70 family)